MLGTSINESRSRGVNSAHNGETHARFNGNLINYFYDLCVVNTVGSFIEVNEKWQKKWIGIKQSLFLSEIDILRGAFKSKFDLNAQYYRDRDKGFRMYFRVGETKKLIDLIKAYVIPTTSYKIRLQ